MRIMLFTGKGGVGKTTIAAATAVCAARSGLRTLVTSTDPAHSLADAFEVEIGDESTVVEENLWAEQINAQARLESNWRDIQEYIISFLSWAGVDAIEAEELSVIPGLDEIFSLTDVKRRVDSDQHDLLIVDCAPTAETLRLLSLPEIMNWYIERIFPVERRVVNTVRPILQRLTTMPIAEDKIFAAVERLHRNLEGVRRILSDPERSSVRLVVNPEKMVIAEARRTYTYLSLFGYRVDAVVANRIIPEEVNDPYFGKWKEIQREHMGTIHDAFQPIPILSSRLFGQEMVGADLLEEMGREIYGDVKVSEILHVEEPMKVRKRGTHYVLTIRLPFADRSTLDVHRRGEELFVRVGSHKRSLILPQALQRLDVRDAGFREDRLDIRFGETPAGRASGARM